MLTLSHSYAVALLIQQGAHLGEGATALSDVLDCRGLHKEGIIAILDAIDAFLIGIRHVLRMVLHEFVHLLVGGIFGILENRIDFIYCSCLTCLAATRLEEGKGAAAILCAVVDSALVLRQILSILYGCHERLDSEKGSQVCGVGGYQDQREEPPRGGDGTCGKCSV